MHFEWIQAALVAVGVMLTKLLDFFMNNGQRKRDDFQEEFRRLQDRVLELEKQIAQNNTEIKRLHEVIGDLRVENATLKVENSHLKQKCQLELKGDK